MFFFDSLLYDVQSLYHNVLETQNILVPPFKRHTYSFSLLLSKQKRHFTTKKQNTDQSTVFPHANATSLKQTTPAATATLLKLLLQHLWKGFFFQLISV